MSAVPQREPAAAVNGPTLIPRVDNLHRVDDLGVKTRRDLNSHTGREENKIKTSQIRLLIPWGPV